MPNKGTFTPVLAAPELAAACANVSAKLRPDSPTFVLTVSNPVVPALWEDEIGGLIQDGDGEGVILE